MNVFLLLVQSYIRNELIIKFLVKTVNVDINL